MFCNKKALQQPHACEHVLVCSVVLFRHGARTPLNYLNSAVIPEPEYPQNILDKVPEYTSVRTRIVPLDGVSQVDCDTEIERQNRSVVFGGAHAGQLTVVGQKQAYDLGRRMNAKYMGTLLSIENFLCEVYFRSTQFSRTTLTAVCVATGLLSCSQPCEELLIHVNPFDEEDIEPKPQLCERLKQLLGADQQQSRVELMANATSKLADLLQIPLEKFSFVNLRDHVSVMTAHGQLLPEILAPHVEVINEYAIMRQTMLTLTGPDHRSGATALRLGYGRLLWVIQATLCKAAAGQGVPKLSCYSVHDTTIMGVLMSMHLFNGKWVPYCADLSFDLYKLGGSYFVKVEYCGVPLILPCCDAEGFSSLSMFNIFFGPLTANECEHEALCSAKSIDLLLNDNNNTRTSD